MSSKHTPAPWIVRFREDGSSYISMGDPSNGPHKAADLFLTADGGDSDLADASLIAAAPELLETLTRKVQDAEQRMFEDWLEFNSPSGDHEAIQRQWLESNDYRSFIGEWREQLDAIAKATGGAQ